MSHFLSSPSHPIHTQCPLSSPITSYLHTYPPAPPTPSQPNAPLSCSPPHNPSTQQCPLSKPPPHHLYNYITYPLYKQSPSSTLLSGEVTWMMLCSSSELIQLHLTLSPCKINQSTCWVNQSLFPKYQIFILDIKSYTCLSNPNINAKNYVE